jgi:hypothetical protein
MYFYVCLWMDMFVFKVRKLKKVHTFGVWFSTLKMTAWKYQSDWKNKLATETLIVQKCGVFNICKPLTAMFLAHRGDTCMVWKRDEEWQ